MKTPVRLVFSVCYIFICTLFLNLSVYAQDAGTELFDVNSIDSLFNEAPSEPTAKTPAEDVPAENKTNSILSDGIRKKGFTLDAGFHFVGGYSPGWKEGTYLHVVGAEAISSLGLDFQISNTLRIKQTIGFSFPSLSIEVKEFFLDYNINDRFFLRAGKHTVNWGISRNYQFANLLNRAPASNAAPGDPYTVKIDIPVGIGGAQLLMLARHASIVDDNKLSFREIGFGGKYNIALRSVDIDLSLLYHNELSLFGAVSLKTTLFKNTEVYLEGLAAVAHNMWNEFRFSGNLGFLQEFFGNKLSLNAELFYNGENEAYWFRPENILQDSASIPFIPGINTALNVVWRPISWKNLKIYGQFLYGFTENTGQLLPGISFTPFSNMTIYLAANIITGSTEGTYYKNNDDKEKRPFSINLAVSIRGDYRRGFYD